jgi:hypothetical protein
MSTAVELFPCGSRICATTPRENQKLEYLRDLRTTGLRNKGENEVQKKVK